MRTFGKAVFLVIFAGLLFAACSTAALEKQMRFGIWAAERDLWDEAVFRWKRVLAASPDSAAAHNNLAVAYEKKGLVEEARKEYELALKLAPDNAKVKFNYIKFKESLGAGDKPGLDKGKEKNEKK
jgi:Flp pilus assembly protein TadD